MKYIRGIRESYVLDMGITQGDIPWVYFTINKEHTLGNYNIDFSYCTFGVMVVI